MVAYAADKPRVVAVNKRCCLTADLLCNHWSLAKNMSMLHDRHDTVLTAMECFVAAAWSLSASDPKVKESVAALPAATRTSHP